MWLRDKGAQEREARGAEAKFYQLHIFHTIGLATWCGEMNFRNHERERFATRRKSESGITLHSGAGSPYDLRGNLHNRGILKKEVDTPYQSRGNFF